jgi:hypothetical protein
MIENRTQEIEGRDKVTHMAEYLHMMLASRDG